MVNSSLPNSTGSRPAQIIPNRQIAGMSAVLLPFTPDGQPDWNATEAHVERTMAAGLTPAVNMDTGYVQLLTESEKGRVLDITASVTGGAFVAGAFVPDLSGDQFDLASYVAECAKIAARGGTPVIFPSHGLNESGDDAWLVALAAIGQAAGPFIGFELGTMFVPYGRIVSLETYERLLSIDACIGAKHSSLRRELEWDRLAIRNRVRPGFTVFTGNDLAIDMVMYGSDYLLGLSTFAPAEFALRDRLWAAGHDGFYELNDVLQYLGHFTFRQPVPGYRHNAAQWFELRGWAECSRTPSAAPQRPASDADVLRSLMAQLDELTERLGAEAPYEGIR